MAVLNGVSENLKVDETDLRVATERRDFNFLRIEGAGMCKIFRLLYFKILHVEPYFHF